MTARFAYIVSDNILPLPLSFFEQYVNDNAAQQQGAIKKEKRFLPFLLLLRLFLVNAQIGTMQKQKQAFANITPSCKPPLGGERGICPEAQAEG